MIGEDKLIHFSGVALGEACTIVLRGASTHILEEADRWGDGGEGRAAGAAGRRQLGPQRAWGPHRRKRRCHRAALLNAACFDEGPGWRWCTIGCLQPPTRAAPAARAPTRSRQVAPRRAVRAE